MSVLVGSLRGAADAFCAHSRINGNPMVAREILRIVALREKEYPRARSALRVRYGHNQSIQGLNAGKAGRRARAIDVVGERSRRGVEKFSPALNSREEVIEYCRRNAMTTGV